MNRNQPSGVKLSPGHTHTQIHMSKAKLGNLDFSIHTYFKYSPHLKSTVPDHTL